MSDFQLTIHHPLTSLQVTGSVWHGAVCVEALLVGTQATAVTPITVHLPKAVEQLRTMMNVYLNGGKVDFLDIELVDNGQTPFQRAVLLATRQVKYGDCCSYSDLAKRAGYPEAIRAAASVLRKNRIPILIPCHRIIRKNGTPGNYCSASVGPDAALKRSLLAMETATIVPARKNYLGRPTS